MGQLIIHAGDFTFNARFEEELAPKTVAAFRKAMPFESQAIHVRWSGEAGWIPLGDLDLGAGVRKPHQLPGAGTHHPLPRRNQRDRDPAGLWWRAVREQDGSTRGQPFHHPDLGLENLTTFGKTVLWKGAQKIRFEEV